MERENGLLMIFKHRMFILFLLQIIVYLFNALNMTNRPNDLMLYTKLYTTSSKLDVAKVPQQSGHVYAICIYPGRKLEVGKVRKVYVDTFVCQCQSKRVRSVLSNDCRSSVVV